MLISLDGVQFLTKAAFFLQFSQTRADHCTFVFLCPIVNLFIEFILKYAFLVTEAQNKEGILPVASLSIALYTSSNSRSRRDVARGVKCCLRHYKRQWIASTSKSHRQASNALQQDKIPILGRAKS